MKLIESKCVQWHDGEQYHVGKVLRRDDNGIYLLYIDDYSCSLVKHSHTGVLEFIRTSELSPYPSEPIPEP